MRSSALEPALLHTQDADRIGDLVERVGTPAGVLAELPRLEVDLVAA
jgi:hypothetical protein